MSIEKLIVKQKQNEWIESKKLEFESLSLSISFDEWLNELEAYEVVTTKLDEEGNEVEATNTYSKLKRPMPRFAASQEEINAVLYTTEEYKQETLDGLVVEVNGKKFYADTVSRIDIQGAIDGANLLGLGSTMWKLAEPYNGAKIVEVTLDELRQANFLALQRKAELIGVQ